MMIYMTIFPMLMLLLVVIIGTAGFSHRTRSGDATFCRSFRAKQDVQEETPFLSALIKVQKDLRANFFFPGHSGGASLPEAFKRLDEPGGSIFKYDLPELDGLDNIHNPDGPLLYSLRLAAELFGAAKTWFLVNGSTGGVLTAIISCAKLFDMRILRKGHDPRSTRKVMIIARNSHKSVFDALKLCQCDAVLLPVVYDDIFGVPVEVTYETLVSVLEMYRGRICGLLLTRPSYQGIALSSSQLRKVIKLAHAHCVPVLIDEAHGAHLRFLARDDLEDAMQCGADVSIQSTHKTSTSLTQTGMMHIRQGIICLPCLNNLKFNKM
jgi:arginine decarboxylase